MNGTSVLPLPVDLSPESVEAVARALAAIREEPAYSIPLDARNESKIVARWGWTNEQVRNLHRRAGLPLQKIPSDTTNGIRYVLIVADVDEWVRRTPAVGDGSDCGAGLRKAVASSGATGGVFPFRRRRRKN